MQAYSLLKDKYSRQASSYDRRWNRTYGQATLQATVDAIPWNDLQRVLDVGCGTGGLLEVAGHGRLHPEIRVVGVDVSLPMLQQAHKKLNGTRHAVWSNAVAEHLPFPGQCFDAVVCANSFHYYRRPLRVLEEFRRVLRPGGCLVLTDWCNDYLACKVSRWSLRLRDRASFRRYGLQQCYGVDQCREMLTRTGFQVESARRFKVNWLWGVMTCKARA